MTKTQRFVWELYFLLNIYYCVQNLINFFNPHSEVNLYWQILCAFDPALRFIYALNIAQVILSAVHLMPLLLFIYRIKIFPPLFWRVLLCFKIVLDVTGQNYELAYLKSIFYQDILLGISAAILPILIFIPTYIALFCYAFRQEKLELRTL